jgi:hypothetical protein
MALMSQSSTWVNILERDGWLLVNVEGKKVGIVITTTEAGKQFLKIAGFHLGESRYVGERHNILSIKVEPIARHLQNSFLVLVRNALPSELRELPIAFL